MTPLELLKIVSVSQLRNFFQTFHYFSIFRCMATPRQKNEIWILPITHNNVTS